MPLARDQYLSHDRETYLARLRHQHDALDYLLYHLTETQMRARTIPEKWSVFENLAHLARYQQVFAGRIEQILREDAPVFARYAAEQDDQFAGWLQKPLPVLAADSRTMRQQLIGQITGVPEEEPKRVGVHPAYGRLNLNGWTKFFLLHEAHHLFTIFKLTAPFRV